MYTNITIKSLLKSVLTLLNVKGNQQKIILLEKTFKAKATRYLKKFQEYTCNKHLNFKYVFQDFKKFFKDQIATDFNCIKQRKKTKL